MKMKNLKTFGLSWLVVVATGVTVLAVSGAAFTTVNELYDGVGHCSEGNPAVNCNHYDGKQYVWLNGGPAVNGLGPDGDYFFAVVVPGGQKNPNDGSATNLSDGVYGDYATRTFKVVGGEVAAAADQPAALIGAHVVAPGGDGLNYIRVWPYDDTTIEDNYILAVCSLAAGYPVTSKSCKYDAFHAPPEVVPPPTPG